MLHTYLWEKVHLVTPTSPLPAHQLKKSILGRRKHFVLNQNTPSCTEKAPATLLERTRPSKALTLQPLRDLRGPVTPLKAYPSLARPGPAQPSSTPLPHPAAKQLPGVRLPQHPAKAEAAPTLTPKGSQLPHTSEPTRQPQRVPQQQAPGNEAVRGPAHRVAERQ